MLLVICRITSMFMYVFSLLLWFPGCGCFTSLVVAIGGAPGRSRQPGLLSLTPGALFSSVLCSHPDFTSVPCPAFPALTVATIAQPVPCEKMWEEKLWIKRAVPSCLTFNKVPLFTPCIPGCSSLAGDRGKLCCSGQFVVFLCFHPHSRRENSGLIKSEKPSYFYIFNTFAQSSENLKSDLLFFFHPFCGDNKTKWDYPFRKNGL